MKKIVSLGFALIILVAVPCLAQDTGFDGQIPLCQNNTTGAVKFAKMKDVDPTKGVDYEPLCNPKTETLIWSTIQRYAPLLEPMTNVAEANFTAQGWTKCYSDLYNNDLTPLSTIFSQCNKKYRLLACRPVGNTSFTVAAFANKHEVVYDTGSDYVTTNISNGAGWYYNSSWSWGFAKAGDPVDKFSCDTDSTNPELRLCWHTMSGNIDGGYRCGTTSGLNGSTAWERVIMHHD